MIPLLVMEMAAFWPVWGWYARRLADSPEDLWCLAALGVAVLASVPRLGRPAQPLCPALLMIAYAGTYWFVPPIFRMGLALLTLGTTLGWSAGSAGLLMLGLPLQDSLAFCLGFPFRLIAAEGAAGLLRAGGVGVHAEGTLLAWGGRLIEVDAPCSGVRMLWAALLLAFLLACLRDAGWRRTLLFAGVAVIGVLIANIFRTAALFYLESGLIRAPALAHAGCGAVVFGGLAFFLGKVCGEAPFVGRSCAPRASSSSPLFGKPSWSSAAEHSSAPHGILIATAAVAALVPLLQVRPTRRAAEPFPGWPAEYGDMQALPLTGRDQGLAGIRVARFRDGRCEYLLRWTARPTRLLHPAEDCYRGSGYEIQPLPLHVDGAGRRWSGFLARRGREAVRVLQRIEGPGGAGWTDVSAWYWSALVGRNGGPWLAVSIAEPVEFSTLPS